MDKVAEIEWVKKYDSEIWFFKSFININGIPKMAIGCASSLYLCDIDENFEFQNRKKILSFSGYYNCVEYYRLGNKEYLIVDTSSYCLFGIDLSDFSIAFLWGMYGSFAAAVYFQQITEEIGAVVSVNGLSRIQFINLKKIIESLKFQPEKRLNEEFDTNSYYLKNFAQEKISSMNRRTDEKFLVAEIKLNDEASCLKYLPSRRILFCSTSKGISSVDLSNGFSRRKVVVHFTSTRTSSDSFFHLNTFTSNMKDFLLVADNHGKIHIYSIIDVKNIIFYREFLIANIDVIYATLITNSRYIITASQDRKLCIYNFESEEISKIDTDDELSYALGWIEVPESHSLKKGFFYSGGKSIFKWKSLGERIWKGDDDEEERRIYVLENVDDFLFCVLDLDDGGIRIKVPKILLN